MKYFILCLVVLSGASSFATGGGKAGAAKDQIVDLEVTDKGFQPSDVKVKPGHVILNITRKSDLTCATSVEIPDHNIKADLPLNKKVTIDLGTLKKGEIKFGCAMKMMVGGKIFVQ